MLRSDFKGRRIDVHCAPGSSVIELTRLLDGLAEVRMHCNDRARNLHFLDAQARVAANGRHEGITDVSEHARPARTYIVYSAFEAGAQWADLRHDVYNLASDRQRLMLLGYLARNFAHHVGTCAFLRSRPVYWSIASVQLGFDLHISVRDLAHRVGVHPETLRRWTKCDGHLSTERFMMWVRAHAVVAYSVLQHASLEDAARALGFRDGAAVRRSAKLLGVRPMHVLRHPESLAWCSLSQREIAREGGNRFAMQAAQTPISRDVKTQVDHRRSIPEFKHLQPGDRAAILEILESTKPDFPRS